MWRNNSFLKYISAPVFWGALSFFLCPEMHQPFDFLAPSSFVLPHIPIEGPSEFRAAVLPLFQDPSKIKSLLGVQAIHSVRYKVFVGRRPFYNPILKFFVQTERGPAIFYAKLFDPSNEKNATREEAVFTLAASLAGITPPSAVFDKLLVIKNIDNGVSLWDLYDEPQWMQFFLDHREQFLQKIGEAYWILNQKLGILHRDVALRHIFITKELKVYLIDFSTLCEKNEIYPEGILSKKINNSKTDFEKVFSYLRNLLDELQFKYPEEFEKRGLTPRDVILLLNRNFLAGYSLKESPNNTPVETSL